MTQENSDEFDEILDVMEVSEDGLSVMFSDGSTWQIIGCDIKTILWLPMDKVGVLETDGKLVHLENDEAVLAIKI